MTDNDELGVLTVGVDEVVEEHEAVESLQSHQDYTTKK